MGAWLEGGGEMPAAVGAVPGLADNLRLQDRVAQRLKARRHERGALELETIEVRTRFDGDAVSGLAAEKRNRARELIEDFMIAANGVIARFLEERRFPVFRRVVRSPERWPRIVEIAADHGEELPPAPDATALNDFLLKRRAADPLRFADLSLAVIKLLGRGEYAASFPGEEVDRPLRPGGERVHPFDRPQPPLPGPRHPAAAQGGAGRARAALRPRRSSTALAAHCTRKEDDAQKVERLVRKAAAACLLGDRIGQEFDGLVTGASPKGTWVRVFDPPVEGRVEQGGEGLDVGDRVRVTLLRTDPERGFIDFARTGPSRVGPGSHHPVHSPAPRR